MHRRGSTESLSSDFVVFAMSAKGINEVGSNEKMRRFLQIALRHNPVNFGDMKTGNSFVVSTEEILAGVKDTSIVHSVFTDADSVGRLLHDLKEADLGVSVIVTGLFEKVGGCCRDAGITPHTIEHSLGVWGRTETLPEQPVMEISTMCGHGMVSFNLIKRVAKDVHRGVITLEDAANTLARQCVCGVFNPKRAEIILADYVASIVQPIARNVIAIDASKCDNCYACEVACLETHPQINHPLCIVDASQGPGVSLHCVHCGTAACMAACPTGEIYRDAATGAVLMKGTSCIGCKLCAMACPFGMIVWDDARGVATKCDLCVDRLRVGKQPACVEACPTGSLTTPATPAMFQRKRNLAIRATLAGWDSSAAVPLFDFQSGKAMANSAIADKIKASVERAQRHSRGSR